MPTPVSATKPGGLAADGCAEIAAPTGPFEFLLPSDNADLPKSFVDDAELETVEPDADSDAIPTLAQQTNLVALLHALPVTTAAPPPIARAASDAEPADKNPLVVESGASYAPPQSEPREAKRAPSFGEDTTAPAAAATPTKTDIAPKVKKLTTSVAPAIPPGGSPELQASHNDARPSKTEVEGQPQLAPPSIAQVLWTATPKRSEASLPVLPQIKIVDQAIEQRAEQSPETFKTAAIVAPNTPSPAANSPAAAPHDSIPIATTSSTASPLHAILPATTSRAAALSGTIAPAAILPTTTLPTTAPLTQPTAVAAEGATTDRSVIGPKPPLPKAAEFAVEQKGETVAPEFPPAISSAAAPAFVLPNADAAILRMAADADVSLNPEQSTDAKRFRGTTGAKPVRAMKDTPAMQSFARPDFAPVRPAMAGLEMSGSTLGEKFSNGAQGETQDLQAAGRNANRAGAEAFPLAAPAIFGAAPRTESDSTTNFAINEPKPLAPAAIVEQVGVSLDHIHQSGKDRVELRLSLEGGGEVSIQLQVRDGAVHASFHTASPELREALEHGWAQLANRNEGLGLPLADPVFKTPANPSSHAGQQDFRERRQEPRQEQNTAFHYYAAAAQPKRAGSSPAPAGRTTSGLNTWA